MGDIKSHFLHFKSSVKKKKTEQKTAFHSYYSVSKGNYTVQTWRPTLLWSTEMVKLLWYKLYC